MPDVISTEVNVAEQDAGLLGSGTTEVAVKAPALNMGLVKAFEMIEWRPAAAHNVQSGRGRNARTIAVPEVTIRSAELRIQTVMAGPDGKLSNVTITFPKAASETYKPLVHALLQTTDKAKIVTEDRPEGRKGPYKIHTTPGFSAGVSDSADEGLLGF